jgi:hypothetical protein
MLGSVGRTRFVVAAVLSSWAALVAMLVLSGALARASDPRSASNPSAALTERLAVLRRPQTPGDELPSGVQLPRLGQGALIPALTRPVGTPAGANLYLAVFTPARGNAPFWSARLGDQVSLVSVAGHTATLTGPVPAVDLTDGTHVAIIGASSQYDVGIVPDGVARVAWTFANGEGEHRYVVRGQAARNVVVAPLHSGTPFLLRATWYAANGSVIPTSDAALRHAVAVRQNAQREQLIRQDYHIRYRPPHALLRSFAVFSVMSRTGVKVAGLTISHPALSSLPLGILSITTHAGNRRFGPELDPQDMRQATTRSGISVWIIPGAHSLCVAEVDKPRFPLLGGGGAGMSCSPSIASAVADGSGLSSGSPGGITWHYGVLPNTKPTLTIRTGPHSHKTIHPPDGVYIYRTAT